MLRRMYHIPAERLPGSAFMTREARNLRETDKKRKQRHPYEEAVKIRKHHPYEGWLNVRRKMDEADLRKKTETNVFADFISRVMPPGQASNVPLLLNPLLTRLCLRLQSCAVGRRGT